MCSNPMSTATSTGQEASVTTPPRPITRKSALSQQSPRSVVQFDGTSATFSCSESSTTSMASKTTKSNGFAKKSVTFDSIQFQEHAIILGDNPGVQSGGPPVTIDWSILRSYQMDLEEYENAAGARRSVGELRMPATIRQGLLEGACNMAEMKRAAAAARKIRNQRQFTMAMAESAEGLEIFMTSVRRKVKRTWSGSRRKSRLSVDDDNSNVNMTKVDPAEQWIEQQMPRTSRRATFPTYLVSRNTHRNSLQSFYDNKQLTKETTATVQDDDMEDGDAVSISSSSSDAIIVAAVAHMTVTE